VPLVVPRLGGLAEAVRDEEDGLLYCGFDAGDLAGRLDRLAGEPGLLERLQAGIGAPRAFTAYVDELERYYAGERPSRVDPEPEGVPLVRWVGDHGAHTSLSIVNDAVTSRLAGTGGARVQRTTAAGAALDAPLPHAADVEVRHRFPADLRPAPSGRLAVIQPWEFGALPRAWVAPMRDEVDELWVPSAYVREMYLAAGVAPDRVHVVPNGVDLERFRPSGDRLALDAPEGARFLFVGGAVGRKGIDVLVRAWLRAFPGREDVALVVKDFGSEGIYRTGRTVRLPELAAAGTAPRVLHLDADLDPGEMAALYRACDVLVHPYRAEGFAMPVLEAMASGLPVIATAGGPTDEFCPPQAGWRLRSRRTPVASGRVEGVETDGVPWWLEPDEEHLVELLQAAAAASAAERARRGAAGRAAAERLSWDAVAELYAERLRSLAARPRRTTVAPAPLPADLAAASRPRVLATPAWRGSDALGELLSAWAQAAPAGTPGGLFLLATPEVDGDGPALEAHVLTAAAAAGVDVESCADITILQEHAAAGRDAALHAAADAYVPLHAACAGHERLARAAGRPVLAPTAAVLRGLIGQGAPAGVMT
jgi:glycosyltransferase involved in cell wall biosynthesis